MVTTAKTAVGDAVQKIVRGFEEAVLGVSLALGKELRYEEKLGATLAIGAVMLYSSVDHISFGKKKAKKA